MAVAKKSVKRPSKAKAAPGGTAAKKGAAKVRDDEGAQITHGTVTITIPKHLAPPPEAGKLSDLQVTRIPRPPHGVGLMCDQTATALEKSGDKFMAPRNVTPESLRAAGTAAEEIDDVIHDVEVLLVTLKQTNLLFDAHAWDLLRQINDQVKVQGKRNKEILDFFKQLTAFLAKGPRQPKPSEDK